MSDIPSDVAGHQFRDWLTALEQAHERVLTSYVRYPFTRGLRAEAAVEDLPETADQRKARKALEKTERQKMITEAAIEAIKAIDEAQAKKIDPNDRPDFDTADPETGVALPANLKSAELSRGPNVGKIIPFPLRPGGLQGARNDAGESLDTLVDQAIDKHISINRFPRDMDARDFSMARYCMAVDQARNTHFGNLAFQKFAPREYAYYEALSYYGKESKALGEMTSGQDGGFLAPEIWTNVFFDINGVACR